MGLIVRMQDCLTPLKYSLHVCLYFPPFLCSVDPAPSVRKALSSSEKRVLQETVGIGSSNHKRYINEDLQVTDEQRQVPCSGREDHSLPSSVTQPLDREKWISHFITLHHLQNGMNPFRKRFQPTVRSSGRQ